MERRRRIDEQLSPMRTFVLHLERLPGDSALTREEADLLQRFAAGAAGAQDLPGGAERWIDCGVLVASNEKGSPDPGDRS
jgi:hypothetical protein